MTFKGGERVLIVACEDDPRVVGRIGRVVDEIPPGKLTGGRWTVAGLGFFTGPRLCHSHELRSVEGKVG
jgi:hypothetical protein